MKGMLKTIFYLLILVAFALSVDYFNVNIFNNKPIFATKYKENDYVKYDTLFYNVYTCLDGNQYIESKNSDFRCPIINHSDFIIRYEDRQCDEKDLFKYEDDYYNYEISCSKNIFLEFNNGDSISMINSIDNNIVSFENIISKLDNNKYKKTSKLVLEITKSNECEIKEINDLIFSYCLDDLSLYLNQQKQNLEKSDITNLIVDLKLETYENNSLYKNDDYSILICKNDKIYISDNNFVYENSYCE